MKKFIDATVFMGMHSSDELTRMACKHFFIDHMEKTIFMSLENVGKCDDVVWQFEREIQDTYYPFMDRLHTVMDIQRVPYDDKTLERNKKIPELNTFQRLTLAQAEGGTLFTFDFALLKMELDHVETLKNPDSEKIFPGDLEHFYQSSLRLRVNDVCHLNQQ